VSDTSLLKSSYDTLSREALLSLVKSLDSEVEKLRHIIRTANRKTYVTKQDKIAASQVTLFEVKDSEASPTPVIKIQGHERKQTRGRKPISSLIPRERHEHYPEDMNCSSCGKEMKVIGEEVTEELDYIPASFKVIEHARMKCACPNCKIGVEVGELPLVVQPIERARPGVGLLAYILVSKYVDHLPLYRLEQMFSRLGITIHRQRMCDWVAEICKYLEPLYRELRKEILTAKYLQADETTIKVQDPEVKDKCLTGYLWSLHVPGVAGYFEYYGNRSAEAALQLLEGFSGTVQTDLYAGYNAVLIPSTVERIACLAHIRRKFVDAHPTASSVCEEVLRRIKEIYSLEDSSLTIEARKIVRETKSRPLLDALRRYLEDASLRTLPKVPLAAALSYALKQWREVERIFESGDYQLDNNAIERQIRPVALGRKNWLFAGSHAGAARSAMIFSFFATCKIHSVNPYEWLRDVIEKIAIPGFTARQLLPHHWKAAQSRGQAL
jgi:transposase